MATTFTVTLRLRCWKWHRCVGCGGAFRYLFARELKGTGGSAQGAERAAQSSAVRVVAEGADWHPCPTCGRVQADMIGGPLVGRHTRLLLACSAAVLACAIAGGAHAFSWFTYAAAGATAAVLAATATLCHVVVAARNPNANLSRNLALAGREVAAGAVQVVTPGDPATAEDLPRPSFTAWHALAAGLGLFAAVALAAPAVLKTAAGWPASNGVPEVVGSGEEITVYFDDSVQALKGYWRGVPKAVVTDDGGTGVGAVEFAAESRDEDWGKSISVKKNAATQRPTLWATLTVPDDPRFVGRTVSVQVDVVVTYPTTAGNGFDNVEQHVSKTFRITTSPTGAQNAYRATFWCGAVVGFVMVVLSGLSFRILARRVAAGAIPARLQAIEGAPET